MLPFGSYPLPYKAENHYLPHDQPAIRQDESGTVHVTHAHMSISEFNQRLPNLTFADLRTFKDALVRDIKHYKTLCPGTGHSNDENLSHIQKEAQGSTGEDQGTLVAVNIQMAKLKAISEGKDPTRIQFNPKEFMGEDHAILEEALIGMALTGNLFNAMFS